MVHWLNCITHNITVREINLNIITVLAHVKLLHVNWLCQSSMGNVSTPERQKIKTQINTKPLNVKPSGVHHKVFILKVCFLKENTTEHYSFPDMWRFQFSAKSWVGKSFYPLQGLYLVKFIFYEVLYLSGVLSSVKSCVLRVLVSVVLPPAGLW